MSDGGVVATCGTFKNNGVIWEIGDDEEVFRQKMEYDPGSIIVLEHQGKIIGMVITIYDPWASFIWHLAIDPQYQGHGLGNLLADEAEHRLKMRGTTSVNGYILPSNKYSLKFVEKRGYAQFPGQVIAVEKPFDRK